MARLALILLAVLAVAVPASAAPLHSDNVSLVTKLPEAVGAASARFSEDGKTMYVSTWQGLRIYDVSKPEAPVRQGFLPLPHFENEDVDAGNGIVIISNDPSEGAGIIYVIDVKNPMLPTIKSSILNGDIIGLTNEDEETEATGHIANCLQGCKYLWTTGTGAGIVIFDLTDLTEPKPVKSMKMPGEGFTHDVFVDQDQIAWITGEDGTFGYDATDPLNPVLKFRTDEKVTNSGNDGPSSPNTANTYPLDFLHHNSIRTSIQLAKPDGTPNPPATEPDPVSSPDPDPAPSTDPGPGASPDPSPAASPDATPSTSPGASPSPGSTSNTGSNPAPASQPSGSGTTAPAPTSSGGTTTPARVPARPSKRALKRKLRRCATKRCKRRARASYRRKMRAYRSSLRRTPRTTLGGLGDVMAITEEDYTRPGCNGQGSFQTWQIKPGETNSDGTTKLDLLDLWTTELNESETLTGRSPATVLCSAHWFDEDRGLIAQGWYDQGVRFLDISDPTDIRQVGYWVTSGTFWAAYYAPTDPKREIVYGLDVTGGIDVLKINRTPTMARRTAPVPDDWFGKARRSGIQASKVWGFACPLLLSTKA